MDSLPDVVPADQFVEDKAKAAESPDVVPAHEFTEDKHLPDVIPAEHFVDDAEKYGSGSQQAIAGLEGFARGATLGGSDIAERALGLSTPEAMLARREQNPWTSGLGSAAGGAALIAGTGGAAAPLEAAWGGGALASAGAYGLEGLAFGAGNAVSDAALGDPTLNGEKIAMHLGIGGILGGALGALTRPFRGANILSGSTVEGLNAPIEEAIPRQNIAAPKNYQEMQDRVQQAVARGETYALPQKQVLEDAVGRVNDLEHPLLPQQLESLNSKSHNDAYKTFRDSEGPVGESIQNYEGLQKKDLTSKIDSTIEGLSPVSPPTTDNIKAGNRAIELFTDNYESEKNALKPLFKAMDTIDLGPLKTDVVPIMEHMSEAVPGVARMFEYGENGALESLKPYDPKWGIDKDTYKAVRQVYGSLKSGAEEPTSFQDLINIRRSLDQHVDVLSQGQGPREIRALKSSMMDYLQNIADEHMPDVGMRDMFKRWAINEQQRGVIEKVFGASVGSPEFGQISKVKPENIVDNIFRNSANIDAAKRILAPHEFNELAANWLTSAKDQYTKNGVFSSNRFGTFLKNHADSLNVAFQDNPETLQRLKDLTTISSIIPDAASINPSGTAKTAMRMMGDKMKDISLGEIIGGSWNPMVLKGLIGKKGLEVLGDIRAQNAAIKEFNQGLAGKSAQQTTMQATQKMLSIINSNIDKRVSAIFSDHEKDK